MNQEIQRYFSGQQGLSLVEIMISLTLGIILLGGTLQLLITSKNSYRLQNGIGSMQENGRYAIYLLRENILLAGYPGFANIEPFVSDHSLDGEEGDQISVQYQSNTDCLGNKTGDGEPVNQINRLFINMDDKTLNCSANGKTLPLVGDIESMQILYGVDEDEDGVANRYINATQVTAGIIEPGVSDWSRVVSVRIALLARSRERSGSVQEHGYHLLDSGTVKFNDAFARQVFTTTIPLRNRIL